MAWPRDPMMVIPNECWVYLQLLIPFMSPFSNMIRAVFLPPFCASTCKDWVVSLEFLKWATGFGKNVGITGKEPGYSFTRAVRGRFDMKRSSMLLFTAVESQLSERYAGSQLSHTVRRENHSIAAVTTDSCICLFNGQVGRGHGSPSNNVIDQEPASCQKLKKKMWIAFLRGPETAFLWPTLVPTLKKWGTSSYAFAPRRKGIVSFSTYRPYLSKEDKIVEWFCSLVMTSVAPDWNPALTTSWSFSSVFQLILLLKSLKKILLVWLHFSIRLISAFNYFYYVLFSFLSQVQTPQKFAFAALLFYTPPKLQRLVTLSAYLHQLSCHKILLKHFNFSQSWSSTLRLLLSLQLPKCACGTEQDDGKTSQVQLRI